MNLYSPMLARRAQRPFDDPNWVFEVKWDGVRAVSYVSDSLSIRSRNNVELLDRFPELRELKELCENVVLDGEIIVFRGGKADFQAAARRTQTSEPREVERLVATSPATYVVFDVLEVDGVSVIDEPLDHRLETLKARLRDGRYVTRSIPVEGRGVEFYEAAAQRGLEGVIAKRKSSTYQPGVRSADWLKITQVKTCDCVVFGYTPGEGARENSFGALLLGLYGDGGPVYVGRVGTGFSDTQLRETREALDGLRVDAPWFDEPDIPQGTVWVEPRLVAQIGYQMLTVDNRLRAPRFQGFRDDKPPRLCSLAQVKPEKLEDYYRRRDFGATPEPVGGAFSGSGNSFVVQEHHARRTHWDLRLERDGVLVSWAVPKGVPLESGVRRLAVKTEDHPLEYGGFEGVIPEGQYGAGGVSIWDTGFYVPVKWGQDKITVVFSGERLNGRYELIRTGGTKGNEWLLFKIDE
jgi:DNA ligase D-like protein (predicted ligase)/DNA ligase D-like protein (predicted 3'-phosphoesterase)